MSQLQLQQPQALPQQQQPQALPQQQQQQPVLVYPNNVNNTPPKHHSDGSFGSVFIVLAVIVVISGIACFLGRLCNHDKSHKPKPSKHNKSSHPNKEGHHGLDHGSQHFRSAKEGGASDIEFGFDKRIPSGKPSGPNYASRENRAGSGAVNHNKPYVNVHHHDMKVGEMKQPGGNGHPHIVIGEPRGRG